MGFTETLFLYLVIGAVVGAARAMLDARATLAKRLLSLAVAVPFWPLFAPFLMVRPSAAPASPKDPGLESRIRAGEARLTAALQSLGGIAEDVLAAEVGRVEGLGRALRTMATRAAEMNALLATPEFSRERAQRTLSSLDDSPNDPRTTSVRARIANIERLESMRQRTLEALERALLEIEEIGSRMALLRFADRPDEEVVRIVRDIAISVEGVAEGLALG
jgi:hypothetical protein